MRLQCYALGSSQDFTPAMRLQGKTLGPSQDFAPVMRLQRETLGSSGFHTTTDVYDCSSAHIHHVCVCVCEGVCAVHVVGTYNACA